MTKPKPLAISVEDPHHLNADKNQDPDLAFFLLGIRIRFFTLMRNRLFINVMRICNH
jgi:hypothetical protein